MRIGGFQKVSLIDFPEHIAAVVFTQGCPWRCQYCHNPSLVLPEKFEKPLDEAEIFAYLQSRVGKLDGVVISGGEPTLHPDLWDFITRVRSLGFRIKLDTNGIFPDRLERLLAAKLIDYVAMDLKAEDKCIGKVIGVENFDPSVLRRSMEIIRASGVPYEFRTTVAPELPISPVQIAKSLRSGEKYYLQAFRPSENNINPKLTVSLDPSAKGKILKELEETSSSLELAWR